MKLLVLSKPQTDRTRMTEEFIRDFLRMHPGIPVKEVNLETRDGTATAALYDIWDQPAILALRDDGSLMQAWQGEELPMMSEVASYNQ
jgi:hypothetical protein